jgi:hypothetical protein
MARHPDRSLPRQARKWADLKAAYRFLNNPRVKADKLSGVHRQLTMQSLADHPMVLCVQDDSDLCAVKIDAEQYVMHSTLAVLPGGELLGMMQQRFFKRVDAPQEETRKQRASRWRESDVWGEAAGEIAAPPANTRLVHVADRGADNLRFMHQCLRNRCDFVVRAHHDRCIDQRSGKLWAKLEAREIAGTTLAEIGTQRGGKGRIVRRGRQAKLAVRFARVQLDEPSNHHEQHDGPLMVNAVYLKEIDPPAEVEPVEWMLLINVAVDSLEQALVVVDYYRSRWVIEEWHRALKEGCRLEESQLEDAEALMRLTAILSVVAVRLIQLRDLAGKENQDPQALRQIVPEIWIKIVAALGKFPWRSLTPMQFWQTIAREGGWLGRKHDGRPGWKAIWTGWHDVQQLVAGAELAASVK